MTGEKKEIKPFDFLTKYTVLVVPSTVRDMDREVPTGRCATVRRHSEVSGKGRGTKSEFMWSFLNHNVDCKYNPPQPMDIVANVTKSLKPNRVITVDYPEEGTYVIVTGGDKEGQPLYKIVVSDTEFWLYPVFVHRYDRSVDTDFRFVEVQVQNENLDTFFLADPDGKLCEGGLKAFLSRLSGIDSDKALSIKVELFKKYCGAAKVTDLSARSEAARKNLQYFADTVGQTTRKFGYNGTGVFMGWLRYYNTIRLDNPTKFDCLLGGHSQHFNQVIEEYF